MPLWTAWDSKDSHWSERRREVLREVYEKNSVRIIDGFKMVPHNPKYLEDDILYPNEEGFIYYGSRVAKIIRDFI